MSKMSTELCTSIIIILIYTTLCDALRMANIVNTSDSHWRPIPAERRGPVTDHFKGVLNNLFSGSVGGVRGVTLEVPKVKQMSQLLQQLFPSDKTRDNIAADSNWKVVNNPYPNDNKHKVLSNFGYAFDDSLDFMSKLNGGKYDKPFTEPILSNAGLSDTGFSSNTLHAQHISPDQEFLYSNPFTGRKGNKHKKLLVNNQTSFGLDLNQYPEDITDLFAPPLPTVDVVYGQPIRGSFPPRPVFDGRSIGKPRAESSKNSITVHYSQVEDDSPAVRPQNRRQVSALYYTPKNRTDNAFDNIEAYNLSETASQLNAVHYIDDLHNKTHI